MNQGRNDRDAAISALLERGKESGFLELSTVEELVDAFNLDEDEVEGLYAELDASGIGVRDDCCPEPAEELSSPGISQSRRSS